MRNTKKNVKLASLDTNLFIYHYQKHPRFKKHTDLVFGQIEKGEFAAVTSVITISEVLSIKAPPKVLKNIKEAFLTTPNLTISDVNQDIALIAAKIRRKYQFRLPDALLLATALYAKADIFVTNDKRLKKFKDLPVILLPEFAIL